MEGNTQDICCICLDTMNDNSQTHILSCEHKYHTECIIDWFRKGKSHCPLCNDNPIQPNSEGGFDYYWPNNQLLNERCSLIRRKYGRKKDCPENVKNAINKLREFEKLYKEANKEYKETQRNPEYKKLKAELRKKRTIMYKYNRNIQNQKRKLIVMFPGFMIN